METYRLFVSSPGDADVERRRVQRVVSALNGEFAGLTRLQAIRWESEHYRAHSTFQTQIPPAAECEIVVGILRWRLGSPLPEDFPDKLPDGEHYPSGAAYEILSAVEKRKAGAPLPDVFVFRYDGGGPSLGRGDYTEILRQWDALAAFFARWFQTPQGTFKAAFNPYKNEDDFEQQLERLLRKWLSARVAGGRVLVWGPAKGSPFRALNVFGARHAPVFFGRAADVRRTSELLREATAKFLLVVGASGAGKSSLMRAGLIPRLTTPGVIAEVDLWRVAAMRPGDARNPFAALAEALMQATPPPEEEGRGPALPEIAEGDCRTPAELAALLESASAAGVRPILAALDRIAARTAQSERLQTPPRIDLALLVDQLDEMFAPSLAPMRAGFAELLAALVATGRVWLLATLRADLYAALLGTPALKGLKDSGATYDLAPPGAAELAEIVRAPAEAAGLVFDLDAATGERLDERLLKEADRPDMLPLVQLALSRLWDARETRGAETVLSLAAYAKLRGVKGIVDEAGEAALATLGETERARLAPLIRRLAETARGQALTARAAPLAEAAPDEAARRLVDALVAARLLTLTGEGGAASLRLAHQRVLSDWGRAARIVAESADFLRVSGEVEESRRRWEAGKRRAELLLARGLPLAEAREMVGKYGAEVSKETLAYVGASRRRAGRAVALAWSAAAVFGLVAIGAGVAAKVAVERGAEAERQTLLAKMSEKEALKQSKIADAQKRQANEKSAEAAAQAMLAIERGQEAQRQKDAAERAASEALAQQKVAEANQAAALASLAETRLESDPAEAMKLALAAWPRDEKSELKRSTFDFSLIQKAIPRQFARHVLVGHTGGVSYVEFSPDQRELLTVSEDGSARTWDALSGAPLRVFDPHAGPLFDAHFSPDGHKIITAGNDGVARIWDSGTGAELERLSGHSASLDGVSFSPDGSRVLTASADHTAILWDTASSKPIATLSGHQDSVRGEFSPDGTRVVTVSGGAEDNINPAVGIWDGQTGRKIAFMDHQPGGVEGVRFSPDGKSFVTWMAQVFPGAEPNANSARIWDLDNGRLRAELIGHKQALQGATYSRDGKWILTTSIDSTIHFWDAEAGRELRVVRYDENDAPGRIEFSPGGTRFITVGTDKLVKVWDTATGKPIATLRGHKAPVNLALYAKKVDRIVSVSDDKTAIIWDATSFSAARLFGGNEVPLNSGEFSHDGSKLVLAAGNGSGVIVEEAASAETQPDKAEVMVAHLNSTGDRLVTGTSDGTVAIWTVPGFKRLRSFENATTLANFALSGDGRYLATDLVAGDEFTVGIVDLGAGETKLLLDGARSLTAVMAFSPDGKHLARANILSEVNVWDLGTGHPEAELKGHRSSIYSLAYSHDGKRIATGSADATVRLWVAETGVSLLVLRGHAKLVSTVEFSSDDRFILTRSNEIRIYDTLSGRQTAAIPLDSSGSAHFSPSGRLVVATLEERGIASVFDAQTGTLIETIPAHAGKITDAKFSPDGKSILTTGRDGYARVWNLGVVTGASIFDIACRQLADHDIGPLAVSVGLGKLQPICTGQEPLPDPEALIAEADKNRDQLISAWVDLFDGRFAEAVEAARPFVLYGAENQKTKAKLITADALMLMDRTDEARTLYQSEAGKLVRQLLSMDEGDVEPVEKMEVDSWEKLALEDFRELRAAGHAKPLMDQLQPVFEASLDRYNQARKNFEAGEEKYRAGDYAGALSIYEAGMKALEALLVETPVQEKYQQLRFSGDAITADCAAHLDDAQTAKEYFHRALDIAQEQIKATTDSEIWQFNLIEASMRLAAIEPDNETLPFQAEDAAKNLIFHGGASGLTELRQLYPKILGALGKIYDKRIDKFVTQKKYAEALAALKDIASRIGFATQFGVSEREALANVLSIESWWALFAHDYETALTASQKVLELDIDEKQKFAPMTNKAHALMFLDRKTEAREAYLAGRGKVSAENENWEHVVLDDFSQLKAAGLTHPLMNEIEAMFKKPK